MKTVLSGMRATSRLHLGNYFGAAANWLRMQEEYNCYFFAIFNDPILKFDKLNLKVLQLLIVFFFEFFFVAHGLSHLFFMKKN